MINMGPTLKTALLASLEKTANGLLQYDPGTRAQLARVQGRPLVINFTEPQGRVAVTSEQQAIRLLGHVESPGAEVSGRLSDMLAWLASGDSVAKHKLSVRGSTQLLLDWRELARQLDIDWADLASGAVGDVAGQQLVSSLRGLGRWSRDQGRYGASQAVEFAVEELQVLVNRPLFDDFSQRNQTLRLDLDRLQARIQRLHNRLSTPPA